MAYPTITIGDFATGRLRIPTNNYSAALLSQVITEVIDENMPELIGVYYSNKAETESGAKWNALYNGGYYEYVEGGVEIIAKTPGLIAVLKHIIFCEYMATSALRRAENGLQNPLAEVGETASSQQLLSAANNKAKELYDRVCDWVKYMGKERDIEVASAVYNAGTGLTTFTVQSVDYLTNRDELTANTGALFTIGSLNVSAKTFTATGNYSTVTGASYVPFIPKKVSFSETLELEVGL